MANLGTVLAEGFGEVFAEIAFRKRSASEKKAIKKAKRRAHKNTNYKALNHGVGRKGYKRVKVGGKRYMFERLSGQERVVKARVGRALGKATRLRK